MIAKCGNTGVAGQAGAKEQQVVRWNPVVPRAGHCVLNFLAIAFAAVLCLPTVSVAKAGQSGWSSSSSSASSPSPTSNVDQTQQAAKAAKAANAKAVQEDVDVGTFYMHKGDYGAAISRFDSAVRRDPKNGKARLLLAESYDKQRNWSAALKAYHDYLREFPNAPDDKKIRKKVAELSRKRD